jgi:hypothetical protein
MLAVAAEIKSSRTHPVLIMATAGACEPLWPEKLKEIADAGFF